MRLKRGGQRGQRDTGQKLASFHGAHYTAQGRSLPDGVDDARLDDHRVPGHERQAK
jgi:hypothetical protein